MKETPSEIIAAARALLAELRRNEINPGSRYVRSLGFVVYYLREPPLKEFMARLEKVLKTETPGPRRRENKPSPRGALSRSTEKQATWSANAKLTDGATL